MNNTHPGNLLYLFLFLLFFVVEKMQAQKVFQSPDSFAAYVVAHHLSLKPLQLQEQIEEQNRNLALAGVLPTARAQATLTDNLILNTQLIPLDFFPGGQPGTYKEVRFGTQYQINASLEGSFSLINAAGWQQLVISRGGQRLATLNTEQAAEPLRFLAVQLYYLELLYRRQQEYARLNALRADSLLNITRIRFENQFADRLDVNRAQYNQLNAQVALLQADNRVRRHHLELLLIAGLTVADSLVIADELPESLTADEGMDIPFGVRVAELQAEQKQALSRAQVRKETLRFLPELTAFGQYGGQAQNNDFRFGASSQRWFGLSAVGLKLEVPLFSGGQRFYSLYKARLNERIADIEYEHTRRKMRKEEEEWRIDYRQSAQECILRTEQVRLAERNYTLALLRYQQQAAGYEAVIQIAGELSAIQQQILQSMASYLSARYKIQYLQKKIR